MAKPRSCACGSKGFSIVNERYVCRECGTRQRQRVQRVPKKANWRQINKRAKLRAGIAV